MYLDIVQMTPVQMKMARAALGWGVRELAEKAGVTANTVTRIENGSDAKQSTIAALRTALESAGIEFIAENGGGPGVRLKKTATGAEEISRQIYTLKDTISSIPAPTEPSPEAAMNTMRKAVAESDLTKLKIARKRIKEKGVSK
jgi:transcriptional regulator with XRE-family HTH domain